MKTLARLIVTLSKPDADGFTFRKGAVLTFPDSDMGEVYFLDELTDSEEYMTGFIEGCLRMLDAEDGRYCGDQMVLEIVDE